MNKLIKSSQKNITPAFSAFRKISDNNAVRTTVTTIKFENGLEVAHATCVPKYARKADYEDILKTMLKMGYSIKDAAAELGISYSYVAKIVRK